MPYKDPIKAAEQKRAYYIANRELCIGRSTAQRLKKQAANAIEKVAKALLPQIIKQRFCQECKTDITLTYVSNHGCRCNLCLKNYRKAYREANLLRIAESKKQWKLKNKEHVAEKDRAYAQLNPEKRTIARKKWIEINPGKNNAAKKLNSVARKKRVPMWLTDDDKWMLDQAYELAALRTKMLGFAWHVDHVIPLNGKKVSGLHTPYNVQVIPWLENLRKGNRVQHV
jgi:hypothetical protein